MYKRYCRKCGELKPTKHKFSRVCDKCYEGPKHLREVDKRRKPKYSWLNGVLINEY